MKLIFVRHGESQANVEQIFSNRGVKHPLTRNGMQQVRRRIEGIKSIGINRIYSSPVTRAIQTATLIADSFNLNIEISDALREFDVGIYEDTSTKCGTAGSMSYQTVINDWMNGSKESRMPSGESLAELENRLGIFIGNVFSELKPNENVICVGHGGLFRCALPGIIHNLSFETTELYPINYLSTIILEKMNGHIVCSEWCGQAIKNC